MNNDDHLKETLRQVIEMVAPGLTPDEEEAIAAFLKVHHDAENHPGGAIKGLYLMVAVQAGLITAEEAVGPIGISPDIYRRKLESAAQTGAHLSRVLRDPELAVKAVRIMEAIDATARAAAGYGIST